MKTCVYTYCDKQLLNRLDTWLDNIKNVDYKCIVGLNLSKDIEEELLKKNIIVKNLEVDYIDKAYFKNEAMKLAPEDAEIFISLDLNELFTEDNWLDDVKECWEQAGCNAIVCGCILFSDKKVIDQRIEKRIKIHNKDFKWTYRACEALETNKDLDAAEILTSIDVYNYNENIENTINLLEEELKDKKDNLYLLSQKAKYYYLNRNLIEAETIYKQILSDKNIDNIENKKYLLESLIQCGNIHREAKNYDIAMWYYHEAIKEDYTYLPPYIGLADMFYDMKMYTLCASMIEASTKYGVRRFEWIENIDSFNNYKYALLCKALDKLNLLDEASMYIDQALEYDSEDIDLLKLQIKVLKNE